MFGRRRRPALLDRVRNLLWPRGGWKRTWSYLLHRMSRLRGSDRSIAVGFACGVGVSFLPLIGLHFALGALLALVIRANVLASAVGTAVGNPWTFPFIWLVSYRIGVALGVGGAGDAEEINFYRRLAAAGDAMANLDMGTFVSVAWPVLQPMLAGGALLGIAAATVSYWLVRSALRAYRVGRERRRAGRERNTVPQDGRPGAMEKKG